MMPLFSYVIAIGPPRPAAIMQVCDGGDASPELLCYSEHQLHSAVGVCWF